MVQGPPWSPESCWRSTKVKSFQQCCPQHQKCISIQPNPKRVHSLPSNQSYGGTRDFSPISLKLALSHESKGTWRMCFSPDRKQSKVHAAAASYKTHIYIYIYINRLFLRLVRAKVNVLTHACPRHSHQLTTWRPWQLGYCVENPNWDHWKIANTSNELPSGELTFCYGKIHHFIAGKISIISTGPFSIANC